MSARLAWTPRQLALFEAGKIRRPRKPGPAPELRTHIAIADMLWKLCLPGWWWSHIPSGELRADKTGALLKRMGLKPGMSDFLLIAPTGAHHWLELKRKGGRLSDAQLDFAAMLEERRVPHATVHSFAEAEAQLREWGVLRPVRG